MNIVVACCFIISLCMLKVVVFQVQRTWWRHSRGQRRRTGASDLYPFPALILPGCISPCPVTYAVPHQLHKQHCWAQGRWGTRLRGAGGWRGGKRQQEVAASLSPHLLTILIQAGTHYPRCTQSFVVGWSLGNKEVSENTHRLNISGLFFFLWGCFFILNYFVFVETLGSVTC